jgi:hypothetical protein
VAELKTKRTGESVSGFLAAIPDEKRRAEARAVNALIRKSTGMTPSMWGRSIVGFGKTTYQGVSGETEWPPVAFAPRKAAITVYLTTGLARHAALLKQLGPHSTGKGCLYLPKFDQIDLKILARMVSDSMPKSAAPIKARRKPRP